MNKKILAGILVVLVLSIVFRSQLALSLMTLVDFIGNQFDLNVVSLIDLLNTIYYL